MSLLFSPLQNYAWSLEHARRLLDAEPGGELVNKIEHQINTRIYNNSFCGLLKKGYVFETVKVGDINFIQLEFDGLKYQCPEKTVSNIMRDDYELLKIIPGPDCNMADGSEIEEPPPIMNDLPAEGKNDPDINTQHGVEHERLPNRKKNPLLRPVMFSLDDITFAMTSCREILEISPQTKMSDHEKSDTFNENQIRNVEDDKIQLDSTSGDLLEKSDIEGLGAENQESMADKMLISKIQRFKPENLSHQLTPAKEDSIAAGLHKPKKRMFGLFGGAKSSSDTQTESEERIQSEKAISIENTIGNMRGAEHQEDINPSDYGELYQQIHIVRLKKQFGAETVGPYRFVFWPTRVIEKGPSKIWADFLVHITGPDNNELVACTDGLYKELLLTIDGKEFNIFSTWDSGVYESHVTLRGKTASVFTVEEEIRRSEPRKILDSYFNQFRYERKGQPKHFVVPFKASNCGEKNIPIVGYVEVGQKKYPLERMEGNTLRYKYAGTEKIIRGHWENGFFILGIDDEQQF